jgi:hypothetical protein
MLIPRALAHREVTYFNLTPAPRTWPSLEAQGFVRCCGGRFVAVPLLSARSRTADSITAALDGVLPEPDLSEMETSLLRVDASQYNWTPRKT